MQYYHGKGEAVYREGAELKPIWAKSSSGVLWRQYYSARRSPRPVTSRTPLASADAAAGGLRGLAEAYATRITDAAAPEAVRLPAALQTPVSTRVGWGWVALGYCAAMTPGGSGVRRGTGAPGTSGEIGMSRSSCTPSARSTISNNGSLS